jgi:hypothetical protein
MIKLWLDLQPEQPKRPLLIGVVEPGEGHVLLAQTEVDDGGSPQLSQLNTLTVESKCGKQIRTL